jgi:hypothetical protein
MQNKGVAWKDVSAKEILGANYSSSSGYQNSAQVTQPPQSGRWRLFNIQSLTHDICTNITVTKTGTKNDVDDGYLLRTATNYSALRWKCNIYWWFPFSSA